MGGMHLGAFSVSLAVKDIEASLSFYKTLGFVEFAGSKDHGWLMLKSGDTVIGLFQGMFEKNLLTFNPGWDQQCGTVQGFADVREVQARLKEAGLTLTQETDPEGSGPGYISLVDPDGNPILIDQHV